MMSSVTDGGLSGATANDQGFHSNSKYCANCGVKETKDIKLKTCTACKSVHYCGVECQKKHRPQHKKDCKKKAAELYDELLFKQPESTHLGDCPICCLPHSLDPGKTSQLVCAGCVVATTTNEIEQGQDEKCPFCRSPSNLSEEQHTKCLMERAEVNCPVALRQLGVTAHLEGRHAEAVKYLKRSVDFGDIDANYQIAVMYAAGRGVEKDDKKRITHMKTAAIGGHPGARLDLAPIEIRNNRPDRAIKHMAIAAKLGDEAGIKGMKAYYELGMVKKEVFAEALRGYQTAVDATKSPQREKARKHFNEFFR